MNKIRKAVIPAAGFGTRFLPATKAQPKEMLPIVDKPVIQYVVEECVASGITDIIIVTGWNKRAIEDHFDEPYELLQRLASAGKQQEFAEIRSISQMANFIYVRQKGPYGTATPVSNARNIIGDEPFAVVWGDEFMQSPIPRLKQIIDVYEEYGKPVVAGMRIHEREELSKYGIADIESVKDNVYKLKGLIEKPAPDQAPSSIATLGAYILPPEIFPIIDSLKPAKNGEYYLADAINTLSKTQDVYLKELENAVYYDCGNKLSYLIANIDLALKRPDLAIGLEQHLKKIFETKLITQK